MSYPFSTHWFCFTDKSEIYQNYFENVSGQTIQYNNSDKPVVQVVDTILDAYDGINAQLGYDYDGLNPIVYKAYASKYLESTTAKETDVYIVLGTVEAGLKQAMISSPVLKIQGAIHNGTQGVIAKAESVLSNVAKGTGTVLENLGQGIVNTSAAFQNLPLILGGAAVLYYFLMIAPKTKKG